MNGAEVNIYCLEDASAIEELKTYGRKWTCMRYSALKMVPI